MIKKKKKIKLTSDYTLVKRVRTLNGASKVEINNPTTERPTFNVPGQVVDEDLLKKSNFILSKRIEKSGRYKNKTGKWVLYDSGDDNLSGELDELSYSDINPNTNSVRDFAYYGSLLSMFRASVNYVVKYFPAEINFTDIETEINGVKYCLIENQYNIDLDTTDVSKDEVDNELRYFSLSSVEYQAMTSDSIRGLCSKNGWEVKTRKLNCEMMVGGPSVSADITIRSDFGGGATKIYEIKAIYVDGEKRYYYESRHKKDYAGDRIRPLSKYLTEFYKNANPFLRILLNQKTEPKFTAFIETPRENEKGFFYTLEKYTWPSHYDYNPDINTAQFTNYVNSLIDLCDYYDEYWTNNAWRVLTHEGIKGLDWTFSRNSSEEKIDSSRIEAIIKLYGRQYDDLRYYLNAFRNMNAVTYSNNNSMPLKKQILNVNNGGFDVKIPIFNSSKDIKTVILYKSQNEGYNSIDAASILSRNLILNTKYINSLKGTRSGILTMLSLLGFDGNDIEINEYVEIAKAKTYKIPSVLGIKYPLIDEVVEYNLNKDNLLGCDDSVDILDGLPLNVVYITDTVTGNTETVEGYVVPWFSKNKKYDGDLYYQMNGGWGKTDKKLIEDTDEETTIKEVVTNYMFSDLSLKVPCFSDINSFKKEFLRLSDSKMVCFVRNINNLENEYTYKDNNEKNDLKSNGSNYFILEEPSLYFVLGYSPMHSKYGWRQIAKYEYNGSVAPSTAGKYLLQSLNTPANSTGNNPHFGNIKYDEGKEYLEYMSQPFKWSLEHNNLNAFGSDDVEDIKNIGFVLDKIIDNKKCWYFAEFANLNDTLREKNNGIFSQHVRVPDIGITTFSPEGLPHNNDISNANSVINIKNIDVTIKVESRFRNEYEKYIYEVVLDYLYYMIPSTSILRVKITNKA